MNANEIARNKRRADGRHWAVCECGTKHRIDWYRSEAVGPMCDDCLARNRAAKRQFNPNAPAIEEELARIAAEVPDSEWDKLPVDLSENLDHYLYGTPKHEAGS